MFKRTCSRRGFIGLTGAGIASVAGGSWLRVAAAADAIEPDLVVFNAKVYTLDSRMPKAEAFAVRDSRFVAVGSSEEIRNLAGKRTRTLDAGQMTIVPGFIDCHNHASGDVLLYEVLVGNPFEVEFVTIASVVDKLRKKASETPAGTWVEGYFFDDTKVRDKRQLNASDLDGVSTDHPVAVHHRGGHTAYYNNKALQMAGITRSTPNPPGGTFDRNAKGDLNGRVTDRALNVFDNVGGRKTYTPAEQSQRSRDALAHISKQFARYGLTSVHHEEGDLFALQQIRARGALKHRVSFETSGSALEAMIAN
ncbi:MAG TPA: amidohydrolase family protein, partial [Steroidobacteraceae bacterium]|nr:amidohydrolase family protein [Steroidobacteraceae bacterium]